MKTRAVYKYIIDMIYPNKCPCCGKIIKWNGYLCDGCLKKISDNSGRCVKCGKKPDDCICSLGLWFDRTYAVTDYGKTVSKAVYKLKNSRNTNFAWYCGITLGKKILADKNAVHSDFIVPVPMRCRKKFERGYNQAEIIAKGIKYVTGTPILKDALIKNPKGKDPVQHKLNAEQRALNAERMFLIGKHDVTGKKIIICDDVMTTGSTVNKCSEILKKHGATYITCAVAAATSRRDAAANSEL